MFRRCQGSGGLFTASRLIVANHCGKPGNESRADWTLVFIGFKYRPRFDFPEASM